MNLFFGWWEIEKNEKRERTIQASAIIAILKRVLELISFTKFVCNTRTDNFRVGHVSDIAKELKQKNVGRSKEKFLLLKLVIVIIQ